MSFNADVKLIEEYNAWVAERKRLATDLTPEAFLVERAKGDAMSKLIEIDALLTARENGRSDTDTLEDIYYLIRGNSE